MRVCWVQVLRAEAKDTGPPAYHNPKQELTCFPGNDCVTLCIAPPPSPVFTQIHSIINKIGSRSDVACGLKRSTLDKQTPFFVHLSVNVICKALSGRSFPEQD